jgi:hypothetical protein
MKVWRIFRASRHAQMRISASFTAAEEFERLHREYGSAKSFITRSTHSSMHHRGRYRRYALLSGRPFIKRDANRVVSITELLRRERK